MSVLLRYNSNKAQLNILVHISPVFIEDYGNVVVMATKAADAAQ